MPPQNCRNNVSILIDSACTPFVTNHGAETKGKLTYFGAMAAVIRVCSAVARAKRSVSEDLGSESEGGWNTSDD